VENILILKKSKIIISIFLILIVTLISFYPSLKNSFINLDDNLYVTENKAIRSITLSNLKNISSSFFITHYLPVTIFSYLLEYHFFKLNPFNYHLTNLILHLLNCLLVFWVIYMLSGRISISCLTALLFGIHPMQVESVAWISERKNVLYAFFFLGAMVSYLYYLRKDRKLKYYFFCLGLFLLALLSKSMAMTLPLILILLDYFTSRKINLAVLIEKIPYFFLSLIFGLIALFGGYLSKVFYYENSYGLLARLIGASHDIIFYLNKLLLPTKLSFLYSYFEIKNNLFCLSLFVVVIILLAAVIISSRYSKKIILGSGLFLLTIFPSIRFLPLEEVLVAERYVYLSAIGIFYLFAQGCSWLYERKIKYYRFIRFLLVSALALMVILLSFLTWERNHVWKDSLSLWNNVLERHPDIASAYNNRGVFFLSKGEYSKALSDFELAIKTKTKYPNNPTFKYYSTYKYYYINLGNSLRALGRNQEAMAVFEQLIKEAEEYFSLLQLNNLPGSKNKVIVCNRKAIEAEAYFNLANIKDLLGDKHKAITLYLRAIELDPRNQYAHDCLGTLYLSLDRKEEARIEFLKVIEIDSTYNPAYVQLAQIYKTLGQKEKLVLLYKKSIANNLDFFDAYYYIGNLYADAQKDKDAILLYNRAIEINPGSKEVCVGLGSSYLTIGRNKEAITWLKKALELDPNLAVAHNNLAAAYYYAQEYDLAIKHSDQAIKLGYIITPKLLELLKPHRK
jgi:protein O-mannosyl-transferase